MKDKHAHARMRLLERYGVEFTDDDFAGIITKITKGQIVKRWHRVSNNARYYTVEWQGRRYRLLYQRHSQTIRTFVPLLTSHEEFALSDTELSIK